MGLANYGNNDPPDTMQSALSRSMKYTEPWFYGTVRGVPPMLPNQQMFSPMRDVAVVLCSCPEYLNGTKKEIKKATICKKCRGSRLPLAPFGGTVRIHSTAPIIHTARGSAGTVRLPSAYNFKQRPSILTAENDPYDMMRRSRLVSPELQPINNVLKSSGSSSSSGSVSSKNRAKSSSPSRSRGRSRKRTPSPRNYVAGEHRSRSVSRKNSNAWLNETEVDAAAAGNRRSILNCDLNAYELISKISHNNEFAPMADDDMYNMHSQKKYENVPAALGGTVKVTSTDILDITALAGQRMNFSGSNKLCTMQQEDDNNQFVYEKFNYPSIDYDTKDLSPVRPPRLQRKPDLDTSGELQESENTSETSPKSEFVLTQASLSHISSDMSTSNIQTSCIKSILKRPPSVSSDSSDTLTINTATGGHHNNKVNKQPMVYAKNILKTTTLATDNKMAKGKITISMAKNSTQVHHNISSSNNSSIVNAQANLNIKEKRNSGSHFYLPMPQRKKVQFLVENEIIYDNLITINDEMTTTTTTYIDDENNKNIVQHVAGITKSNGESNNFQQLEETQNESTKKIVSIKNGSGTMGQGHHEADIVATTVDTNRVNANRVSLINFNSSTKPAVHDLTPLAEVTVNKAWRKNDEGKLIFYLLLI